MPADVTDEVMIAFGIALRSSSLAPKANELTRDVATLWNRLVEQNPELHLSKVVPPSHRRPPTRIQLAAMPASFRDDLEVHLAWAACQDPFAPDARSRPLSPRSICLRREHVLTVITALAKGGISVASITSLASLVTPAAFKIVLRQMLARPYRSDSNASDKLQAFGRKLMDQAHAEAEASGSVSSRSALSFRDGLMISILVFVCPRRRNIAGLTLGRTLFRTGTAWHIRFEENETKNKRPSDVPLPPELTPYIETYLTRFRSVFRSSSEHCGVWASVKGTPLTGGPFIKPSAAEQKSNSDNR